MSHFATHCPLPVDSQKFFLYSGKVEPGIPKFTLPPFRFEYENRTIGLIEVCGELRSGILMIPLVAVSANVAIAKAFSKCTFDSNKNQKIN